MDLRRLRYFIAVAEEQHYGRAAARLHMSTPPLSQRIRELEGELGVTLFERTSRKVALTDAGRRLLDDARSVLRAVERFERSAAELAATAPGQTLTVGFCHGSERIARLAARRFHERHPDDAIRPEAMTTLHMAEALIAGRLSVGIVRSPVPDELASRLLARVRFGHLAVPATHRLAGVASIAPHDLDGEAILLVSRREAPAYHDATVGYFAQHGVRPRWMEHAATQVERMLDMVAVGSGLGWLNEYQAAEFRHDGVVAVPLSVVTRYEDFNLAWRADDDSKAVAAFVEIALGIVQPDTSR